ncbi:MAG TPA: hypothetical protein VMD59_02140, partial [Acidimicrobiales bacterium]|nr:hypothetical protein [Acidimicrobiales bacterium]
QSPFEAARRRLGEEQLRRLVLAGAYTLRDAAAMTGVGAPVVELVASGAVLPEVLEAAADLAEEGVAADVISVTSLGRCYQGWRRAGALASGADLDLDVDADAGPGRSTLPAAGHLATLARPGAPVVTIHDAASHAMAWIGSALGVPAVALGVDRFETSPLLDDRYAAGGLLPGQIVNAALLALERAALARP